MVDFLRRATKKSLLTMLKKAKQIDNRLLSRLFEAVMFKEEYEEYSSGATGFVRQDGTTPLTANWDAGAFEIRAQTLESDVTTGTAPLTIASTTKVTNLNADQVDGKDETAFVLVDGTRSMTGNLKIDSAANPAVQVRKGGDTNDYGELTSTGTVTQITSVASSGNNSFIYLAPQVAAGTDDAYLRLFPAPATAPGQNYIQIYAPDGTEHLRWTGTTGDLNMYQGDLYIEKSTDPSVYFREGQDTNDYGRIYHNGNNGGLPSFKIEARGDTASTPQIFLDPIANSAGAAYIYMFNGTTTAGTSALILYNADGTANQQHTFYCGGGDADLCQQGGQATIGGTGGTSRLSVVGSIAATVTTQTDSTLTLGETHHTVLCDGTSNTVTITLPAASGCTGRIYNIKAINIDNAVTVDQTGAETIDGSTDAITLALMETITVQSDGTNWWII